MRMNREASSHHGHRHGHHGYGGHRGHGAWPGSDADSDALDAVVLSDACPLCSNGCPLDNPMCERGESYAQRMSA
ncbi:MAG: hypothetical protein ACOX69_09925 [Coriobacteriales bacterium]